ncbi:hypothetical protein F5Y12DRAFT_695708 [Xylaria sp. FL1777]|nr:hypothetical protein F5Y12DRAFT_695708 [Xylaria sp. FL1777]
MEFIDPQLLGPEDNAIVPKSEQAEFSYSDYLYNGSDVDWYSPSEANDNAYRSVYPAWECPYPEEPLMAMEPDFQPEFNPGVFLGPEVPMNYSFGPPKFPCSRYYYKDKSTQTDFESAPSASPSASPPDSPLDSPLTSPPTSEPSTPVQRKYTMQPRRSTRAPRPSRIARSTSFIVEPLQLQGECLKTPLSELAIHMPKFREIDLDAFVRRGALERMTRGKISRPLNAFMLYRMFYAQAAGTFLKTDRMMHISQLMGSSWRSETRDVKNLFYEYSYIEKKVHAELFPKYKYLQRARTSSLDVDEEADDVDDAEEDCITVA